MALSELAMKNDLVTLARVYNEGKKKISDFLRGGGRDIKNSFLQTAWELSI